MEPVIVEKPAKEVSQKQASAFYTGALGTPAFPGATDEPLKGIGRAAFIDGELVGLIAGNSLPHNERPDEPMIFLHGGVHPEKRRLGIGGRLMEAIMKEARGIASRSTAYAILSEVEAEKVAPFLLRRGFAENGRLMRYERDLVGAPPAAAETLEPIKLYQGGDLTTDAAIVELYRRGYRARPVIPELSEDAMQRRTATPGRVHFLMYDGELLVGYASAYTTGSEHLVESLVVARSHWRSGASDALARATIRHAADQGCGKVIGYVESVNHASLAMVERHGLTRASQVVRYARVIEGHSQGRRSGN